MTCKRVERALNSFRKWGNNNRAVIAEFLGFVCFGECCLCPSRSWPISVVSFLSVCRPTFISSGRFSEAKTTLLMIPRVEKYDAFQRISLPCFQLSSELIESFGKLRTNRPRTRRDVNYAIFQLEARLMEAEMIVNRICQSFHRKRNSERSCLEALRPVQNLHLVHRVSKDRTGPASLPTDEIW